MTEKKDVSKMVGQIYELLSEVDQEERGRIIQATRVLLGDDGAYLTKIEEKEDDLIGDVPDIKSIQKYFAEKSPINKGEELAVAARYLEIYEKSEEHSKADLKRIITDSRRNFDDKNYNRDMTNAKSQSGFFNLNRGRDQNKLSYSGQNFVDALPDRTAAKKVMVNKKKSTRKNTPKKASKATKTK